ncbi:MAG TPA: THUMP domain-containing protein [Candidatus Binatia bacterium]
MARRDDEDWNVLVICSRGRTGAALSLLAKIGRFRTGGFPQVLIGTVARSGSAAGDGLLEGIEELAAADPPWPDAVDRVLPVENAVSFVRDDVTETLCEHFEPLAARLCGKTFYVRSHLRGLKGRIEHPAVERALGDFLYEKASSAGAAPKVSFKDPDFIVAVEVVGRRAGFAFLSREVRSRPMVRVK